MPQIFSLLRSWKEVFGVPKSWKLLSCGAQYVPRWRPKWDFVDRSFLAWRITRVRKRVVRVRENMLISFFRSARIEEGERKNNIKFTDPNYPISDSADNTNLGLKFEDIRDLSTEIFYSNFAALGSSRLYVLSNFFGFRHGPYIRDPVYTERG